MNFSSGIMERYDFDVAVTSGGSGGGFRSVAGDFRGGTERSVNAGQSLRRKRPRRPGARPPPHVVIIDAALAQAFDLKRKKAFECK